MKTIGVATATLVLVITNTVQNKKAETVSLLIDPDF